MDEEAIDLLLVLARYVRALVQTGRAGVLDRDAALVEIDQCLRAVERRLERPWEAT